MPKGLEEEGAGSSESAALALANARLSHLYSLGLPFFGKRILDVGCGIVHLRRSLAEQACEVVHADPRPDTIAHLKAHFPDAQAHLLNPERDWLGQLGEFHTVLCYGLLHRLENPVAALRNLASVCRELLLADTVVTDHPSPLLRLVDEPSPCANLGLRPSPAFLARTLSRAGFAFVYAPRTPPNHHDYRFQPVGDLSWVRDGNPLRSVFVAARRPLDNPDLALLFAGPDAAPSSDFSPVPSSPLSEVMIDVGAHRGETSFSLAYRNPALRVYAFEPNLEIARELMGLLPNYIVLPVAVAERDGAADFHINDYTAASSLLPLDPAGLSRWIRGDQLRVSRTVTVPTMRLDSFLNRAAVSLVDHLKIDAQGADLAVVRSAGDRLNDIRRITLEVHVTPHPLYAGASGKQETLAFLRQRGFRLTAVEKQSCDQEENLTFVRYA